MRSNCSQKFGPVTHYAFEATTLSWHAKRNTWQKNAHETYRGLSEYFFAIAALHSILNAPKHQVLELALRCELHPFAPARSIGHPFEPRIDPNLRRLGCGWRDLKAQ